MLYIHIWVKKRQTSLKDKNLTRFYFDLGNWRSRTENVYEGI